MVEKMVMTTVASVLLLLPLLLGSISSTHSLEQQQQYAGRPWMDKKLPIPERVEALLKTLDVEHKVPQTFATHSGMATVQQFLKNGLGAAKFLKLFHGDVEKAIESRNELQEKFVAATGVPISFINEGLHGGAPGGTIFPMPVNQGASWNKSMVEQIAKVIALEARAIGVDTLFAPVVNMIQDPRFGRLQEGYSENPLLTTHLGEAAVRGLQNNAPRGAYLDNFSVSSLGKHYAAYGTPMGGLNGGPAEISKRTLYEIFLRPWKRMAAAGLRSLMPAHNTVQDVPCHANRWLLGDVMRKEFSFGDGVALSDCNDIGVLKDYRIATNRSHAAALGLLAGVDLDLQCGTDPDKWSYNALPQALEEGLITESDLDTTVRRILAHKFANGLFDEGPVDAQRAMKILDRPQHRALAREAAGQSIVLLKNEGAALPLPRNRKLSIALLGPTASSECDCGAATLSLIGSYALEGAKVTTLDEGLRSVPEVDVSHVSWEPGMASAAGAPGTGGDAEKLAAAVRLANSSDVSILVLGDIEGKNNGGCGEWGDRDDLDLQGGQLELLEEVAKVARKTVVILVHGRPQTFGRSNEVLDNVDALFAAWRPGEEFGNAMVDLLFGTVNPSAKLTQSWPRTVGQVGSGSSPWQQTVRGKWLANAEGVQDPDGRRYDGYVSSSTLSSSPLFYFGYGLSYTKFEYMKFSVGQSNEEGVLWTAHVTLQNIGSVAGVEIVQIYAKDPAGLPFVPFWKRLVGFARVRLDPGEVKTTTVDILEEDVQMYSTGDQPELTLYQGGYILTCGGSSLTLPLNATVEI